ncbi:GlxA family transcriptional regulator [Caballeronia sp. DA-9]|uniref:GlxA family transcriptional regulator n=1 Tax=Caballeronia sp. DA-9 TaxID=3436237 RepID=UPI003F679ABA
MPGFSLLDFAAIAEPLRSANRLGGDLYCWKVLSADGHAVTASNGMSMAVDGPLEAIEAAYILFVVAAYDPLKHLDRTLKHWLKRHANAGVILGGVDTGAFVLAEAGLLRDFRITVHWETIAAFVERYPTLRITHEIFEIDGQRITSAGGTASMDLMLELIARRHGRDLAIRVADQFVLGQIRPQKNLQRTRFAESHGVTNSKLLSAIAHMERNIEQPLAMDIIACNVNITRRQLERLFKTTMDETPAGFYLRIRLDRSQQLLRQTGLSILDVSVASGFESASYFARCYKQRFGKSPREDRRETAGVRDNTAN